MAVNTDIATGIEGINKTRVSPQRLWMFTAVIVSIFYAQYFISAGSFLL